MNETVHIENVVLGGGEAGKYLAWDLAQQGRPVVVIERALIGGSCPNIACLPSKNVIRSAKVADLVSRARVVRRANRGRDGGHEGCPPAQTRDGRRHDRHPPEEVCGPASRVPPCRRHPCGAAHGRGETS